MNSHDDVLRRIDRLSTALRTLPTSSFAAHCDELRAHSQRPPRFAFGGLTNSGKSTLLNALGIALAGCQLAPIASRTCTDCPILFVYGPRPRLVGTGLNGHDQVLCETFDSVLSLVKMLAQLGQYQGDASAPARFRLLTVELPVPYLQRVQLLDTPGENSLAERHSELTRSQLRDVDGVFFCLNASQRGHERNRQLLEFLTTACQKPVWGVLTRIDGQEADPYALMQDETWWSSFHTYFQSPPVPPPYRVDRLIPVYGQMALGIQAATDLELQAIARLRAAFPESRWMELTSHPSMQPIFLSDSLASATLSVAERTRLVRMLTLRGVGWIGQLAHEGFQPDAIRSRILERSGIPLIGRLLDNLSAPNLQAARLEAALPELARRIADLRGRLSPLQDALSECLEWIGAHRRNQPSESFRNQDGMSDSRPSSSQSQRRTIDFL